MALQLTQILPSDVTLTDAYHKIDWWCGSVAASPIDVQVSVYKDATAREAGKPPAMSKRLSVTLDLNATGNILQNLYAAVKAHADYTGAVDLL